jgi:6-phosphogluconate dehydrogenase (decarboxylating)
MRIAMVGRFFSRQDNSFAMRMLAALRNEFGGHAGKTTSPGKKKGKRGG